MFKVICGCTRRPQCTPPLYQNLSISRDFDKIQSWRSLWKFWIRNMVSFKWTWPSVEVGTTKFCLWHQFCFWLHFLCKSFYSWNLIYYLSGQSFQTASSCVHTHDNTSLPFSITVDKKWNVSPYHFHNRLYYCFITYILIFSYSPKRKYRNPRWFRCFYFYIFLNSHRGYAG